MSDHFELQERQESEPNLYEHGRRAAGQDVPPYGDLDALIRVHEQRFLADCVLEGPTADIYAAQHAKERALDIFRTHLRRRDTDQYLRQAIHDETLRVRAETRELQRRAQSQVTA